MITIDNLLSGLVGAAGVTILTAIVQWRFTLRKQRQEVAGHLRKLRRRVELDKLDTNGVFDAFKEYRDLIEDACYAYATYTLRPVKIQKAIAAFCGYANNHSYRTVNLMPGDRQEFLDRIDSLEAKLGIEDIPGRSPRSSATV